MVDRPLTLSSEPYLYPGADDVGYIGSSTKNFYKIYGRYVYANNVSLTSDERLKENIRTLQNPIEKIQNVRAVKFDFKTSINPEWPSKKIEEIEEKSKDKIGFLAQELIEVYPELVEYDSVSDQYSVDYIGMIPVLLEAIKEQQSMITTMQEEISSLSQGVEYKSSTINSSNLPDSGELATELFQNQPNPFTEETTIEYYLAESIKSARLFIYDMSGKQLYNYELHPMGEGVITISEGKLEAGLYIYSLVADGNLIGTKQMMLTDY